MKILEQENTITDIKDSLDWLSSKLEIREERIGEFEDRDPIWTTKKKDWKLTEIESSGPVGQ